MADLGELVLVSCTGHVLAKHRAIVTQLKVDLELCCNIHVYHRAIPEKKIAVKMNAGRFS